jgi:hypothetical protein
MIKHNITISTKPLESKIKTYQRYYVCDMN